MRALRGRPATERLPLDEPQDKQWRELSAWRKERRAELVARREAIAPADKRAWDATITRLLEAGFPHLCALTVGFCWPYRNEFDARFAIRTFRQRGATAALPAVVDKRGPLEFRQWSPGVSMKAQVYGIPVPDGTPVVAPHAAIVPMNGFDEQGYRLGYGGGYFDRTLAASRPRPIAIGVSYELGRLPTIHPQPHDIAMDFVVTEAGIHRAAGGRLEVIDVAASAGQVAVLCAVRGLGAVAGGYSSPPCYAGEFPGYFSGDEKAERS